MPEKVFPKRDTAIKRALIAALTDVVTDGFQEQTLACLVEKASTFDPDIPRFSYNSQIGNLVREQLVTYLPCDFDRTQAEANVPKRRSREVKLTGSSIIATNQQQRNQLLEIVRNWDRIRANSRSTLGS